MAPARFITHSVVAEVGACVPSPPSDTELNRRGTSAHGFSRRAIG
jgi:hypothetical protein